MKEAKKELGKAFLNLANMLLVLYLLGYYLTNYFVGFYLIKEGSNE